MQHWNTDVIRDILEQFLDDDYAVRVSGPCGDHDTSTIIVESSDGGCCDVQGWLIEGKSFCDSGTNIDDNDVDLIAVNVDRHGLENAEPEDLMVVASSVKALRKAGYWVTTNGWKSWF